MKPLIALGNRKFQSAFDWSVLLTCNFFPGGKVFSAFVLKYEPHVRCGPLARANELKCPVTAETVTPCALHRIPAKSFRRLLEADAQLSSYLHKLHSWEVYVQVVQVADMGSISARRRLEGLLCEFMRSLSDPKMRFRIPLKQWEIAQCLCVTPEYITRLFKQLEREGILQRKKGWFVVPDLEKLRHGHF